jgi:hypothetical protein
VPAGTTLLVSQNFGRWKVQWEGGDTDTTHETQAQAIARARAIVRSYPPGIVRQIWVLLSERAVWAEWTYGKDPYPPLE